jgi:hypothetical protein
MFCSSVNGSLSIGLLPAQRRPGLVARSCKSGNVLSERDLVVKGETSLGKLEPD